MGAGKTTAGRLAALHSGVPFVDIDDAIERAEGATVAEIFERDGEGRFRELERAHVVRALAGPEGIVALGGGALGDPTTCADLEWHTVVHLDVAYPEAMRRIGEEPGRPMLRIADPLALYRERRIAYESTAHHTIPTDGKTLAEVAAEVAAFLAPAAAGEQAPIEVALGARSYSVHVGADIARNAATLLPDRPAERAIVVTHPSLTELAKPLVDSLAEATANVHVITVEAGETTKSPGAVAALYARLAALRTTRRDLMVAFGGGVVCDLTGFVASTYHRGMPVLHVPTTLLAQVDAAIGGKTAINLERGKNLVGTIHQPVAVVCDVSLLTALPDEELRSGLAEVVKYGLIADPSLLDEVSVHAARIFDRDEDVLVSIVRRCAAIKASIVASDEHESGPREVLNYGHTFGHAIEHVTGMRHGEAIAVGMMAAAHLAVDLGMLDPVAVGTHSRPLGAVGLSLTASFDPPAVLDALLRDKKHRDALRFVLLAAPGEPRTGIPATVEQIQEALGKVAG
jgi:3-dehydroquinate synthase